MPSPSSASPGRPARHGGPGRDAPHRLIKRYANRTLYDTDSGEPTSLRRIEQLLHAGIDIRVLDNDTRADITSEVLVGILANSVSTSAVDIPLLTSLIRSPDDVVAALSTQEHRMEELQAMGARVRILSSAIEALLREVDQQEDHPPSAPRQRPARRQAS